MNKSSVIIVLSIFAVIALIGVTTLWGSSSTGSFTGYFISSDELEDVRFNPMYIIGSLVLVCTVSLFARVYYNRKNTQN